MNIDCVIPENIHSCSKEGYWKFQKGGGLDKKKILKACMNQNWNSLRDWGGRGSNQ